MDHERYLKKSAGLHLINSEYWNKIVLSWNGLLKDTWLESQSTWNCSVSGANA